MKPIALALAACAALASAACESAPPRAVDMPGRRIVPGDRPTVETETMTGRRTIVIERAPDGTGRSGFICAVEFVDPKETPALPTERDLELPDRDSRAALIVSGGRSRSFASRDARGRLRLRDFPDHLVAYLDLTFVGETVDPEMSLPANVFQDETNWLRVTGTFEVRPAR